MFHCNDVTRPAQPPERLDLRAPPGADPAHPSPPGQPLGIFCLVAQLVACRPRARGPHACRRRNAHDRRRPGFSAAGIHSAWGAPWLIAGLAVVLGISGPLMSRWRPPRQPIRSSGAGQHHGRSQRHEARGPDHGQGLGCCSISTLVARIPASGCIRLPFSWSNSPRRGRSPAREDGSPVDYSRSCLPVASLATARR